MKLTLAIFVLSHFLTSCGAIKTQKEATFADFGSEKREDGVGVLDKPIPSLSRPDPLDFGKRVRLILQVDGGGIMGIVPAGVLYKIEQELVGKGKTKRGCLRELFSACVGTSTGAIIAGAVTAGVKGDAIKKFYEEDGTKLFLGEGRYSFPAFPLWKNKFKRNIFQEKLFEVINSCRQEECSFLTLDELYDGPLLVIPAYDLASKRTQYFRTREQNDSPLRSEANAGIKLVDAISASAFSAVLYFGRLTAPNYEWRHVHADGTQKWMRGAVFNDGGQGTQNTALFQAYIEAAVRGWADKEQVVIISLGTGADYSHRSYERAKGMFLSEQMSDFFFRNQARSESAILQWLGLERLAKSNPNIKVFRFDFNNKGKGFSSFTFKEGQLKEYQEEVDKITARDDFKSLMADLRKCEIVSPTENLRRLR